MPGHLQGQGGKSSERTHVGRGLWWAGITEGGFGEGQSSREEPVARGGPDPSPLPLSEVASLALRFWLGDFSFSYGSGVDEEQHNEGLCPPQGDRPRALPCPTLPSPAWASH